MKPISTPANPRKNFTDFIKFEKRISISLTEYLTKITWMIEKRKVERNKSPMKIPINKDKQVKFAKKNAERIEIYKSMR